jgi:NTE family protein
MNGIPKVAISCQGGGSHAAFAAGVLSELLSPSYVDRFELVGLSGTSGGAICAALAWAGLISGGRRRRASVYSACGAILKCTISSTR